MGGEHGPFIAAADGGLLPNAYSWNTNHTVVYFEQPAGVGFSYSSNPSDYYAYDDEVAATDNAAFLTAFFNLYPQYQNLPLYLTSESYGGNYIPQLARKILEGSDARLAAQLRTGGVAIGNPVFSSDTASFENIMDLVQLDILYGHALLPLSFVRHAVPVAVRPLRARLTPLPGDRLQGGRLRLALRAAGAVRPDAAQNAQPRRHLLWRPSL